MMKKKPAKPAIPAERHGTIRQAITEALKGENTFRKRTVCRGGRFGK